MEGKEIVRRIEALKHSTLDEAEACEHAEAHLKEALFHVESGGVLQSALSLVKALSVLLPKVEEYAEDGWIAARVVKESLGELTRERDIEACVRCLDEATKKHLVLAHDGATNVFLIPGQRSTGELEYALSVGGVGERAESEDFDTFDEAWTAFQKLVETRRTKPRTKRTDR